MKEIYDEFEAGKENLLSLIPDTTTKCSVESFFWNCFKPAVMDIIEKQLLEADAEIKELKKRIEELEREYLIEEQRTPLGH